MIELVLDASVCLKWYLSGDLYEPDSDIARDLLERVTEGLVQAKQPSVWLAEIAAVLARKLPLDAARYARELQRLEVDIDDDASVLARAIKLSIELNHHFFDTIYHAIAIERKISLITADEHYFRKARALGSIVLLRDWRPPPLGVAEPTREYVVSRSKPRQRHQRSTNTRSSTDPGAKKLPRIRTPVGS